MSDFVFLFRGGDKLTSPANMQANMQATGSQATGLQCLDALLAERGDDAAELREAGKAVLIQLKAYEAILGTGVS